jgi:hypothetical protein
MLEKRDFVERLQELRTKARDIRDGTVPPPKVVSAPTPNVPTAKDVMPIDPELSDAAIEDMTLPDIKEILKFHGACTRASESEMVACAYACACACAAAASAAAYASTVPSAAPSAAC